MNNVTKWSYRLGLASGLCALIGGICLTILDAVAPAGTMGNRQAVESVVGILAIDLIVTSFFGGYIFFLSYSHLRLRSPL